MRANGWLFEVARIGKAFELFHAGNIEDAAAKTISACSNQPLNGNSSGLSDSKVMLKRVPGDLLSQKPTPCKAFEVGLEGLFEVNIKRSLLTGIKQSLYRLLRHPVRAREACASRNRRSGTQSPACSDDRSTGLFAGLSSPDILRKAVTFTTDDTPVDLVCTLVDSCEGDSTESLANVLIERRVNQACKQAMLQYRLKDS